MNVVSLNFTSSTRLSEEGGPIAGRKAIPTARNQMATRGCKYIGMSILIRACGPERLSVLYIHAYREGYIHEHLRDDPYIRGEVIKERHQYTSSIAIY